MVNGRKLDALLEPMVTEYVARNRAAQAIKADLDRIAIGLWPVIDHVTLRTFDIDRRAQDFVAFGYTYAETIEYGDWYAKVYRAPGYPALFVDQAYADARGTTSVIPRWVAKFGDGVFHHIAVRVEEIELAIAHLTSKGIRFAGEIVGERGGALRQIFSVPETVDGEPFSVLELAERHAGYQGFMPPQADSLMRSTVLR